MKTQSARSVVIPTVLAFVAAIYFGTAPSRAAAPNGASFQADEDVLNIKNKAQRGDAAAQNRLGDMYFNGPWQESPEDLVLAAKWYRKAADQGYSKAQNNLGAMYATGFGVPQDYSQAIAWWRKAADQANWPAIYRLGILFSTGQHVPTDYTEAYKWFSIAVPLIPEAETQNRKNAEISIASIAAKMTSAQIAEAQRRARDWNARHRHPAR